MEVDLEIILNYWTSVEKRGVRWEQEELFIRDMDSDESEGCWVRSHSETGVRRHEKPDVSLFRKTMTIAWREV